MTRKTDDGSGSILAGLLWPVVILVVGGIGFLAGGYFQDNAVIGLSLLVCTFGVYSLAEAVLGAVIDISPRVGGIVVTLGLGALVLVLFYGYHLLNAE